MRRLRHIKTICLVLLCVVFCASCTPSAIDNDDKSDKNETNNPPSKPLALAEVLSPSEEFLAFFDLNNKVEIQIDIKESELKQINQDYENYSSFSSKSPIYRMCDVTFKVNDTIYEFDEVGIRMKGNTSRRSFYDDLVGINDMIHYKLSFKETFDDEDYYKEPKIFASTEERTMRKDRTLLGMEKLDLKWNKNFDSSHIKELHAYDFFREHNVLAQRLNKAKVTLKTEKGQYNMGVFNMLECVDESFIERYLPQVDRGGDLYKCAWGTGGGASLQSGSLNGIGIEDEDIGYFPTYDLKTNKKTSQNSLLINLIQSLNSKSIQELDSLLSTLIDENYFLIYEAISYIVGNPDDLRNNYNNYYIYFLKSNGKAIIIPYDYDRVFGLNWDWNPTNDGMTSIAPFSKKMSTGANQGNPLYLKTIVNDANIRLKEAFAEVLNELKTSDFVSSEYFNERFELAKSLYKNDIIPSKSEIGWAGVGFDNSINSTLNATNQNIDFKTYIDLKLATLSSSLG